MSAPPTAAVIGAGSSGIAAAKALHERGIPFTVFEASDRVGGNAYVDHFGVRDRIRFETKVTHARRGEDGVWELELGDRSVERFDALLVANGHHWEARWPEPMFPGHETFAGTQMGRARLRLDQLPNDSRLPMKLRMKALEAMIRVQVVRIIDRLQHGAITPKPNIARLHSDEVELADGTGERVDVVVYCTGYRISFPFFAPELISAPDNGIELFRRLMHPEIDTVYFVALVQPLGAAMPIAEAQGQWIADELTGAYRRPSRSQMLHDIRAENEAMRRRYVASKRHTIQVDFDDYMLALERERRAGADRARAVGFAPAIAGRA